jgi:hypothetical protein
MIGRIATLAFGTVALSFAAAAPAAAAATRPELLVKLVECRAITDSTQRLACYDAQVAALDAAEKKRDVVVIDRAQVRETRKSLFGFTLPNLGIFGSRSDKDDKEIAAEDITQIESTVASARGSQNGNWSIVLTDGAGTWDATSGVSVPPRPGDKVIIRKATFGSYLGSVGYNHGVRFRRVN